MSTIRTTLEKIMEYRELGGNTDKQFIAAVARLVQPDLDEQELATRYEVDVSDVSTADEFLQHSDGLIEQERDIIKWVELKRAEWQQDEAVIETLHSDVEARLQDWFGHKHQPVTRKQAEQLYDAADGNLELIEDVLRITTRKKLAGKRIYSPVGFMLTLLQQPEEDIRREAAEAKKQAPKWLKSNREPIPVED